MKNALLILFLLFSIAGKSQNLSNLQLYANGQKSYTQRDWVYASVYLYAYIQRSPNEFKNIDFKNEVIAAYDFSVSELNLRLADYKNLLAWQKKEQQKQNGGMSNTTQGLEVSPPVLRENQPSVISSKAGIYSPEKSKVIRNKIDQ